MSYTIRPAASRSYIVLKIKGDLTSEMALRQDLEAHFLGKKLGISRYLVDATESRNVDSVSNNYDFAFKDIMISPDIDKNARVALLVSPEDNSHDFVETVARNAGLDVTLFRDRDLAIRHLLRD